MQLFLNAGIRSNAGTAYGNPEYYVRFTIDQYNVHWDIIIERLNVLMANNGTYPSPRFEIANNIAKAKAKAKEKSGKMKTMQQEQCPGPDYDAGFTC